MASQRKVASYGTRRVPSRSEAARKGKDAILDSHPLAAIHSPSTRLYSSTYLSAHVSSQKNPLSLQSAPSKTFERALAVRARVAESTFTDVDFPPLTRPQSGSGLASVGEPAPAPGPKLGNESSKVVTVAQPIEVFIARCLSLAPAITVGPQAVSSTHALSEEMPASTPLSLEDKLEDFKGRHQRLIRENVVREDRRKLEEDERKREFVKRWEDNNGFGSVKFEESGDSFGISTCASSGLVLSTVAGLGDISVNEWGSNSGSAPSLSSSCSSLDFPAPARRSRSPSPDARISPTEWLEYSRFIAGYALYSARHDRAKGKGKESLETEPQMITLIEACRCGLCLSDFGAVFERGRGARRLSVF
ncbi:hypothetical protein GALMADRAFT_147728 [Galerina marginata CBS 339.88]|uniref:Uncharacterized protein n=1 Tax=Galerina marginata (strain CBS 339.88) TaxID=685588 RepID=A0A067SG07_GALM3|nr:hypothetical protein GALMADRAFT_147728 [Galerina marginata CBS 339.88]